jgi:hypothetical protein
MNYSVMGCRNFKLIVFLSMQDRLLICVSSRDSVLPPLCAVQAVMGIIADQLIKSLPPGSLVSTASGVNRTEPKPTGVWRISNKAALLLS